MYRPRWSEGGVVAPTTDVFVYLPPGRRPSVANLLDSEGHVRARVSPKVLQDALSRTRGLWMAEGLAEQIEAWVARDDWRTRFARFERKLRRHLAGDGTAPAAWRAVERALAVRLRPYQIEGVLFAVREGRALLADDMGLGKTVQTIAAIVLLRALGEAHRTVVVCPASLKDQWRREVMRHAPSLSVCVLEGSRRRRREAIRTREADVWVLNFATLRHDLGELRALDAALLVVDEAQRIKNWNTLTAKSVKALETTRVLALTGTPLENRLQELHSVMELLDRRALGPMWRLLPEHALGADADGKIVGVRGLELLRRRMGTRWLRRTKEEVLSELPERLDDVRYASMSDGQHAAHARHQQRAAHILRKKVLLQADVLALMSELQSMRMICNGLALYLFAEVEPKLDSWSVEKLLAEYPSPKLELAREQLLALLDAGEKVVVFSQWRRMLVLLERILRPELRARGLRCLEFHGELDGARRARAVAAFHDDPDARLFLSTDAGGVGLNLQAAASTVVQLDLPWNPAVFEQRVGRVHRMGQKGSVRVLTLTAPAGIEGRVAEGITHKRALFEGLFDGTSDEVVFGTNDPFLERMRGIVGVGDFTALPNEGLVHREEPPDAEVRRAPAEVPMPEVEELEVVLGSVVVRATRTGGDVRVNLDGVGDDAWSHLRRFLRALGDGGETSLASGTAAGV
ncbi:MAG: DEAD/DEAH box helicase [Sandaracinus sp.]|nr:DEAD/DEAH box helicase [Sandaracinus sp.]MCB9631862.1 DEAD/DEAH box helicase [Sandaracinus sp.]